MGCVPLLLLMLLFRKHAGPACGRRHRRRNCLIDRIVVGRGRGCPYRSRERSRTSGLSTARVLFMGADVRLSLTYRLAHHTMRGRRGPLGLSMLTDWWHAF